MKETNEMVVATAPIDAINTIQVVSQPDLIKFRVFFYNESFYSSSVIESADAIIEAEDESNLEEIIEQDYKKYTVCFKYYGYEEAEEQE